MMMLIPLNQWHWVLEFSLVSLASKGRLSFKLLVLNKTDKFKSEECNVCGFLSGCFCGVGVTSVSFKVEYPSSICILCMFSAT